MTDVAELVTSSRSSDSEAFAELVRRHQDMAVGYAVMILGDFHLAQDASQEAFLEAYQRLDQLREPAAFGGWLRRIVFKRCDRITRRKRPPMVNLDAAATVPDTTATHEPAETRDMRRQVLDAIRSLPPAVGETTLLYYFGRRNQREIAAFLEVPVGTVKRRLHEGRKLLKGRLMHMAADALQTKRPSRDRRFEEAILQIITPHEQTHGDAFYNFMDSGDDQWHSVSPNEYALGRIHDSHYDWKTSRIGMKDGKIVGAWNTYDLTMRIGCAEVKVIGQNCSRTHEDYRGQDIDLKLSTASFEAARERGYDLGLTFEHGDQMARLQELGYHEAFRSNAWFVRTCDLPTEPAGVELREFMYWNDVPELADVYNRWNAGITGTAARPTFRRSKHAELDGPGQYWVGEDGKPIGFVRTSNGAFDRTHERQGFHFESLFVVDDHAGDPEQVARVVAEMARGYDASTVWFFGMSYRAPLARWLRRYETFRLFHFTTRYLVRVLNLRQCLEKMTGELEQRIAGSLLADANESLALGYEDQ
ncbi:MAG: sigma-70 family RNA polymerase sigma factor [Planctomycetota bacterium]